MQLKSYTNLYFYFCAPFIFVGVMWIKELYFYPSILYYMLCIFLFQISIVFCATISNLFLIAKLRRPLSKWFSMMDAINAVSFFFLQNVSSGDLLIIFTLRFFNPTLSLHYKLFNSSKEVNLSCSYGHFLLSIWLQ